MRRFQKRCGLRTALAAAAALCGLAGAPRAAAAAVRPHALFSDGMVLQQGMSVPVWGTANEGERVTVEFMGQKVSTEARGGQWTVRLKKLTATQSPQTLSIAGTNRVDVHNVLVGEVWICSGQSNMQWPLNQTDGSAEAISAASLPQIRLLTVPRRATDEPQSEVQAQWVECSPTTVPGFSAVAFYFGRHVQRALKVPVGLISTNVGGTPAEAWTSRQVLNSTPGLAQILERHEVALHNYPAQRAAYLAALSRYQQEAARAQQEGRTPPPAPRAPAAPGSSPQRPTGLYNAMIAPLVPYALRGAIWYQGESNAGRAWEYRTLFPAMIRNWREDWGQGDFPFYFVQLAPFMKKVAEPVESNWAELREAQSYTVQTVPNTGQAVITDVGEENDIHPRKKEPVGARLALLALAQAYGKRVAASGPEFAGLRVEGDRAVLRFRHAGEGLVARGGPLTGFTVAGSDRRWHNAEAAIEGDRLVVRSAAVFKPVAVRFGWANFPVVNLWNRDGLPASPFRTDDWPVTTQPRESR